MVRVLRVVCLTLLVAFSFFGCGKTKVRIANNTGATLSTVGVSVYQSGSSNTISFSNVANGTTTDTADWSDDAHLTVSVDASGYSEETDSVTLDAGKTNTLTLTLSSGNIVYTRAAD